MYFDRVPYQTNAGLRQPKFSVHYRYLEMRRLEDEESGIIIQLCIRIKDSHCIHRQEQGILNCKNVALGEVTNQK